MKKVLIADDSDFMRDILKEILTKLGFNVVGEAENGAKAVEMYKDLRPDILSMDINMPLKNGLNALREIKALDKNAKVVICSSISQRYHIDEAMDIGATEYVIKPFVPEKIAKIYRKIINQ